MTHTNHTQTESADAHSPVPAQASASAPTFKRVLVRKLVNAPVGPGEDPYTLTTVSLDEGQYTRLLKFAYNNPILLHAALREAALSVVMPAPEVALTYSTLSTRKRQDFSEAVRTKALNSLRGAYRPELAAKGALSAEEREALANNKAWDGEAS